jgi:hypothetical protein
LRIFGLTLYLEFVSESFNLGHQQFNGRFVSCIVVYIVSFYTKEESAVRFSFIFSSVYVSEAFFETLLTAGTNANTELEFSGWQLILIVEGIFMLLLGLLTWFYLPSFPETCTFLNAADRVLAVARGRDGYEQEETSLITKTTHINTKLPAFKFQYVHFLDTISSAKLWLASVCMLTIICTLDFLSVLVPEVSGQILNNFNQCSSNCTEEENNALKDGLPFEITIRSYCCH